MREDCYEVLQSIFFVKYNVSHVLVSAVPVKIRKKFNNVQFGPNQILVLGCLNARRALINLLCQIIKRQKTFPHNTVINNK